MPAPYESRSTRSSLPARDEALAPHVGGTYEGTVHRIHARERGAGVDHEWPGHGDLVAESPERLYDPRIDPVLDLEHASVKSVVTETFAVVERVEPRRLDRRLGPHIEDGDVQ